MLMQARDLSRFIDIASIDALLHVVIASMRINMALRV
jgi:hypothetical protein